MIKLQAPDNATSASYGGEVYEVKNGFVNVPEEAAQALADHGFTVAVETGRKAKASE